MLQLYKLFLIFLVIFLITTMQVLAVPNVMSISVGNANIDFQLIDPFGNITGYDPIQKIKLENIPNTRYVSVLPYEYYSQIPIGHEIHPLESSNDTIIDIGKYQLKIYNTYKTIEIYSIDIAIGYFQNHNILTAYLPNRTIYPNSTWVYEFDVTAVPQGVSDKSAAGVSHYNTLPIIKVAQPTDLIKDLTTAGQLGYIGNSHFVSELTKEINEIEAEKAKGKVDDGLTPAQKAKKEYQELLSEITEKYNKPEGDEFVKKEAYDVLREDIEYIINHIQ